MSLSRRHFEALAELVRDLPERPSKTDVAQALAVFAASENPRFDGARFFEAALGKR